MITRYKGRKVVLSPLDTSDEAIQKYTEWMSDTAYCHWLGHGDSVTGLIAEKKWAEEAALNTRDKLHFSIYTQDEVPQLIGTCSLEKRHTDSWELGILIGDEDYQERGYGTDTMKTLVRFAFEELHAHRVELSVYADNGRARACYEKIGFVECGCKHEVRWYRGKWHDLVYMEMLEQTYNKADVWLEAYMV